MKNRKKVSLVLAVLFIAAFIIPHGAYSQGPPTQPAFKAEELQQILAPIALYPDALIAQILMASTYPLEIVQAARWVSQNKNLTGDALTKALEKQSWDPSVKSLVNFPQVLQMMNDKLDWTQKLGDAVLAQQKDVLDTIQTLRAKAQASGNLKATKEQKVIVQEKVIIIEPASPQVVYVPAYNPAVVYGVWAYPAYPPYPVYPPGYVATTAAFSFMAGAAVGAAWGYAWGNTNWHGGNVNVNIYQNTNINNNINRNAYVKATPYGAAGGQGSWQHNPQHRGGVAYRNQATAQQYNRAGSAQGMQNREAYRGKSQGAGISTQPTGAGGRAGSTGVGRQQGPSTMDRGGQHSAFGGMNKGSATKMQSDRGMSSRQSMSSMQRGGGGISGGGRGGSGGGRGGGRR